MTKHTSAPSNGTETETFTPGQLVTWIYKPRGGYGYEILCRAEVIRPTAKRVVIRVWRKVDGREIPVEKTVRPENLRARKKRASNVANKCKIVYDGPTVVQVSPVRSMPSWFCETHKCSFNTNRKIPYPKHCPVAQPESLKERRKSARGVEAAKTGGAS